MNIKERWGKRYLTVANIVILLIGLIFILVGYIMDSSNLELSSILVNVGSDTIVVSVIFLLGRILLIDPQEELKEQLTKIDEKLSKTQSSSFFLTASELKLQFSTEDLIANSQDLLLGGVVLGNTVRGYRHHWLRRIEKGARLKFLVLDPSSPDVIAISKMWGDPREVLEQEIRLTLRELEILREKVQINQLSSVDIRLLDRAPVISFAVLNPNNSDGILFAGLRLYGQGASTRPEFVIRTEDKWFNRFVKVCEDLWHNAMPVPLNDYTSQANLSKDDTD